MNFFAHTRTKRNTAFAMLLVWLFAMASGVANACLLQTHEPHSMIEVSAATKSQAHAVLLDHLGTIAGHDEDSGSSKESCLKACDDGTHTLFKAHSGVDQTNPGLAPLVTTLWTGLPTVVATSHRLDDLAIPPVGPPFRVRYSRLVL